MVKCRHFGARFDGNLIWSDKGTKETKNCSEKMFALPLVSQKKVNRKQLTSKPCLGCGEKGTGDHFKPRRQQTKGTTGVKVKCHQNQST